ncbi:MAG TPA: FAD-binding oxidoreductase [Xanthobacteraceae bacterium]|nr:FAD-binding oxidoreductase [Xanthobacteraceae bacterium]
MNDATNPVPTQSAQTGPLNPDLIARFTAIVGDRYAITNSAEQEAYLVEMRDLYHGRTPLVLRPGSTAEVSAILKLANETRTPVVPQGGNTGLVGGQVPHETGNEIVLSLGRLDRIREIDPVSNTMTCEAGVVLQRAQEAAAEADRLFPLSLGAEGSCTIGGNLSTNAGGTGALSYGIARDLALGLEVVLADGRVLNGLSKVKKDNTGYDLKHLFIGAEGTLGIITAAVLKLFPRPRAVSVAFIGLKSPHEALALLKLAQQRAGAGVTSFEIMPRIGLEFVLRHAPGTRDPLSKTHPWYVVMELSSSTAGIEQAAEDILSQAYERGLIEDAAVAATVEQGRAFMHLRHALSEVQRHEGGSIKDDVTVPVVLVPQFIDEAIAAAQDLVPGCRPVPFGHVGDGNVHFNVSQPPGADKAAFLSHWEEMNARIHAIVARMGGSISAEHGIGRLKRHLLPQVKDPVAYALMQTLKQTLDPNGILNPGKVL